MSYEAVTNLSSSDFQQRLSGKKVVILYPWMTSKNLYLCHFHAENSAGLFYYRAQDGQISLKQWISGMVNEIGLVQEGFGANLQQALNTSPASNHWGEALASDLASIKEQPLTLFLDELDRIPFDDDFQQFFVALVDELPKNVRIVISSRLLDYQPWYDLVVRGDAVVMGTEQRADDGMFSQYPVSKPRLEVYVFGRGYTIVNGQFVTNWDGALPRNLFFFFMDKPLVTRSEIFQTFWPNLPTKEATNVFHVTKRKVTERLSLGLPDAVELTRYSGGFYTPSEKYIRHYDAVSFQADIEKAAMTSDDAEEERLLLRATRLYRAPYLQDGEMEWMKERREQLKQMNSGALISLGRIYRRRQDDKQALGAYLRALRDTPEREDIQREVISLYVSMGQRDDARAQYKYLTSMLRERFNITPSRDTQELYNSIAP
jgi:DNA-binding SARP family transcriptional activator